MVLWMRGSSTSKNGHKQKDFISRVYHRMGTLLCILGYQPPSRTLDNEDSGLKSLRRRKVITIVTKFFEDYFTVVCVALIMYNVFAVLWITSVIRHAMRNPLPRWFGYWNWFLSILQFLFYPCLTPLFLLGSWIKKKDFVALLRQWECLETHVMVDSARKRTFAQRIFGHGLVRIFLGFVSFGLLSHQGQALLLLKGAWKQAYLLFHMSLCFLTVNCPDLLLQVSVYGVNVVMDGLYARLQQMEVELSTTQKRQVAVLTPPETSNISQEEPATEPRDPNEGVLSADDALADDKSLDTEVNKGHFSHVSSRNGAMVTDHSLRGQETLHLKLTSPLIPPLGGRRRSLGSSEVTLSTTVVSPDRTPSLHPSPVPSHQVSPVRASVHTIHPARIPNGHGLKRTQGNKHAVTSMPSGIETMRGKASVLYDPELDGMQREREKITPRGFSTNGNYTEDYERLTTEKGLMCEDVQKVYLNQHRQSSIICLHDTPLSSSFASDTKKDEEELCHRLFDIFRKDGQEEYQKKSSSRLKELGVTKDDIKSEVFANTSSADENRDPIESNNAIETKAFAGFTCLYLDMLKVVEATNKALSPFLLLQMVHCIVLTTVGIYYLVAELLNATIVPGTLTNVAIILHLFNLIHYYCITTNYGHELMVWTRKLRITLQTICLYTKSAKIKAQASEMQGVVEAFPLELRASDFFLLGRGLVCSIVSNVITYLVVGLQFSLSCKDPKDDRINHFDQLLRRSAVKTP